MAHFGVGFLVLGMLAVIFSASWTWVLLVIPVVLSACIIRLRTVADRETVTARGLLGSQSVRWEDIEGLAFTKGSWARARLTDGRELRLPAVTFATVPQLTAVSGGRVPNPYG
jgi:hypothetical protein